MSKMTKHNKKIPKLTISLSHNRAFSTDESFLRDPNAYNDKINEGAKEGEGILKPGFRL